VFAQRTDTGKRAISINIAQLLTRELEAGINTPDFYQGFQAKAEQVKNGFLGFLLDAKRQNKSVVGYGAAAKGNTLLNFAGVKADLLTVICDAAPSKQHKFMPGSRIPIVPPSRLKELTPDFVVIFPWNIASEVMEQHGYIREWGGKFVTAVPELVIM
jgi:hypothetical protein